MYIMDCISSYQLSMSLISNLVNREQDFHPLNQHKAACFCDNFWQVLLKLMTFLFSYTHGMSSTLQSTMGNEIPGSFIFLRCPNSEGEPSEKRGATAHLYNEQLPQEQKDHLGLH
jgi:hypothetical protein